MYILILYITLCGCLPATSHMSEQLQYTVYDMPTTAVNPPASSQPVFHSPARRSPLPQPVLLVSQWLRGCGCAGRLERLHRARPPPRLLSQEPISPVSPPSVPILGLLGKHLSLPPLFPQSPCLLQSRTLKAILATVLPQTEEGIPCVSQSPVHSHLSR